MSLAVSGHRKEDDPGLGKIMNQGSHRVWKTGKTIMVRELYFGSKVRDFF